MESTRVMATEVWGGMAIAASVVAMLLIVIAVALVLIDLLMCLLLMEAAMLHPIVVSMVVAATETPAVGTAKLVTGEGCGCGGHGDQESQRGKQSLHWNCLVNMELGLSDHPGIT